MGATYLPVQLRTIVAAVTLAAAVGCEAPPANKEPPAASYSAGTYQVKVDEAVITVPGAAVTSTFFYLAGVQPLLGRVFVKEDASSSSAGVTVLSHEFWKERFEASPSIIGRTIEVDGRSTTIVGIAPPGFSFPNGARMWLRKRDGS